VTSLTISHKHFFVVYWFDMHIIFLILNKIAFQKEQQKRRSVRAKILSVLKKIALV
jgi:hypothetical protein